MSQPFSYQESEQRGAVAALISGCERIVSRGMLPEAEELRLRELIIAVCSKFDMLTIAERSEAA